MKKLLLVALCCSLFVACTNQKPAEKKSDAAPAETKLQPAEFADAKYAEIGKKGLAALSSGDIDVMMANYADNAVYQWNSGDSLAGKQAITDYWRQRRTEVIDSISFSDAIWLPIKVNQPQSVEQPGIWLLSWFQVDTKYKTGKKMTQWLHTDFHFDANDKIDRVVQYIDRVPINAAMTK